MSSVESSPAKSIASDTSMGGYGAQGRRHTAHSPRQHCVPGEGQGGEERSGAPGTCNLDPKSGVSATAQLSAPAPDLPHATGFHLCDLFHASLQEQAEHEAQHQAAHGASGPAGPGGQGSGVHPTEQHVLLVSLPSQGPSARVANAEGVEEQGQTLCGPSCSPLALPSCSLDSFLARTRSWTAETGDALEQATAQAHDRSTPSLSSQAYRLDMAYPMVPFSSVMQMMLLQVARAPSSARMYVLLVLHAGCRVAASCVVVVVCCARCVARAVRAPGAVAGVGAFVTSERGMGVGRGWARGRGR